MSCGLKKIQEGWVFNNPEWEACSSNQIEYLLVKEIVGMACALFFTCFLETTLVVGPPVLPTPKLVGDVLNHGKVDVTILSPAIIEEQCRTPGGLESLRKTKSVYYAGALLASKAGDLLISHTHVIPPIGSSEAGGYLTTGNDLPDSWAYVRFLEPAGAVFEHRFDDLYELIFVRQPDYSTQIIFYLYPERDGYETKGLWTEHPTQKGLWKIIGRADDHSALIGGHGYEGPVLLIDLYPGPMEDDHASFIASLQPNIDNVNRQVHSAVKLRADRIIMAKKKKPFFRTAKGTVGRIQTLRLYKEEIAAIFE
ncbi:AMP-binding enzyme [Penicillium argentinense]|uniref:AMP-binding enzyme n=1 Tax=Penicillium argentinense TaxID=1131581 RepID=A0A9W9EX69_9EURO|nr:AMP-binding enzyme [Penicillium argentinense]KAJ5089622.1 AMP-binding enzyme [Penicillium argentinense]